MKTFVFIIITIIAPCLHSEELISIYTDHYPPFVTYNEQTKRIAGATSSLVRKIFDSAQINDKLEQAPWARSVFYSKHHGFTGIYPAAAG